MATTLELKGVPVNSAVAFNTSLAGSTRFTNTFGETANTCMKSTIEATTASPFSRSRVGGPVTTLTFKECTGESIVVDTGGSLNLEAIAGTTNATVFSSNAQWTSPSPFGNLTCTTASTGTDIGKITGVKEGTAIMDISAVLNCGIMTAKWTRTYNITSPGGLGFTA